MKRSEINRYVREALDFLAEHRFALPEWATWTPAMWADCGDACREIRDGAPYADGTPRLAYNTCQVCAGSPYAYFAYQQGALVCQNCGNAFDLSSVGQAAGGCNPLPVTDYQTDADTITSPAAALKQASAAFANWKKGLQ